MCKSTAEGGQRCASHTRDKLAAKSAAVESAALAGDMTALRAAQSEWENAAAEYASTEEGHAHLSAQSEAALSGGDYDTSALLSTVIRKGEAMRAANQETAALIKAVRLSQAAVVPVARTVMPPVVESAAPRVPDLTPQQREDWVQVLREFDEAASGIASIGYSHTAESWGTLYPSDIKAYLPEIDSDIGAADADDKQLAQVLHVVGMVRGIRLHEPRWTEEEGYEYSEAGLIARRERKKAWFRYTERLSACLDAQAHRALQHPNAGALTFDKAQKSGFATPEELTARPDVPMDYLKSAILSARTESGVHADGWGKAREARFSDNSLALVLAAKDADSFHRNEALSQVMMMPLETISAKDRKWLAGNLHRMPGSEENQRILAESIKGWALGYTDVVERDSLGTALAGSKVAAVQAIGHALLSSGTGTALEAEEPKQTKRRWLS